MPKKGDHVDDNQAFRMSQAVRSSWKKKKEAQQLLRQEAGYAYPWQDPAVIARFEARVVKQRKGEMCWLWQMNTSQSKWTQFHPGPQCLITTWNGQQMPAQRFAYQMVHGPLEKGVQIFHTCSNEGYRCVNPEHLCTHGELNMRRGGITPEIVRLVREKWKEMRSPIVENGKVEPPVTETIVIKEIMRHVQGKFKVVISANTVVNIARGRSYTWVS